MEHSSCPVDVISLCSADGKLRPLRLRVQEADQSLVRVDIDEIVETNEVKFVGMEATVFLCRGIVGQRKCFFELKYAMRSHTWYLQRRIY